MTEQQSGCPDHDTRRDTLRILGVAGFNCLLPGSVEVLNAQHAHGTTGKTTVLPDSPQFFKGDDWEVVRRIADLIIPRTETPGALDVGVPLYIDLMVSASAGQQELFGPGLKWIASQASQRFERSFTSLTEEQQLAILLPLSDAIDRGKPSSLPERFFRAFKDLTADGFYTSRAGLTQDLGFKGDTVLEAFPGCAHKEHIG
jgi:hypothetical protein